MVVCRDHDPIFLALGIFLVSIVLMPTTFVQGTEQAIGRGSVIGRILPTDSNATVYLILPLHEIAGSSVTNADGEYAITVPQGIYDLEIVAEGDYLNRTVFQIGILENEVTEIDDIILARPDEVGSISGYINPVIEGTVVKIKKFGVSEFAGETVVDNNGRYSFTNLEPDTYGLFVYFNSDQGFRDYKWGMIEVMSNASISGINLTFTPLSSEHSIDRVTIEFKAGLSEGEKKGILESFNSRIMSHYSYSQHYVVSIPPNTTVEDMIDLFKANPNVTGAYLNTFLDMGVDGYVMESEEDGLNGSNSGAEDPIPAENISIPEEKIDKAPFEPEPLKVKLSWLERIIRFFKSLF